MATGSGSRQSAKLQRIIASTEELMLDQGYGAVTFRSVASATGTALLMEFMALANHRDIVRAVIGEGSERVRRVMLASIEPRWAAYGLDAETLPPAAVLFLLSCIPRMIHLEESLGTSTGHVEATELVERFLDRLEPPPA